MIRQIRATLLRSTGPKQPRQAVWTRYYSWMDTAMPRAVQVLLREGQTGDIIEFSGEAEGFQLGIIRKDKNNSLKVEWSPLVHSSSHLMKLMVGYL